MVPNLISFSVHRCPIVSLGGGVDVILQTQGGCRLCRSGNLHIGLLCSSCAEDSLRIVFDDRLVATSSVLFERRADKQAKPPLFDN